MPQPTQTDDTVDTLTLLQQLQARRDERVDELAGMVATRDTARTEFEQRNTTFQAIEKPTDEARTAHDEARAAFTVDEAAFATEFSRREGEIQNLDQRIAEQELLERRRQRAADASQGDARVTSEPMTYRRDNAHEVSYFRDLAASDPKLGQYFGGVNGAEASERLVRHGKETEVWITRRAQERERRATRDIEDAEASARALHGQRFRGFDASPFERRINPNRTDGQGGFFVPPLWLVDEFIPGLRAGRVAAGLCRQMELPEGTDSINIPKLQGLTQVGVQGQDGAAVASQDFTDTSIQANVKTLAGQQDVGIQLIEQSPGRIIDEVIMRDLQADYDRLVDRQVIVGNGTNSAALNGGQILGIYPQSNWGANQVTWTTATPLGTGFNMVLGAMASKTAYNRFDLTNFNFLLHPRRWFWFATTLDGPSGTSGRPLVNQQAAAFNTSAVYDALEVPAQGHVGRVPFGPDAYIDANVPATDNGSGALTGTLDVGMAAKWDDLWLFEGNVRTRVLPEVLSGTLEIRFQLYNYVAFLVRYGPALTLAQGTGFGAPASAIDSSVQF